MNELPPWYRETWRRLQALQANERLGHALLFSGPAGAGIEQLTSLFANQILCETGDFANRPCGNCRGCRLIAAGSHPDLKLVRPEADGKAIVVDQVREITTYYTLKSHYNHGKVVIVQAAEAMNRAAANAILKILEEPPAGALILLIGHRLSAMPMTVRSRCIRVPCGSIDRVLALTWLEERLPNLDAAAVSALLTQADGAPLFALELAASDRTSVETDLIDALIAMQASTTHALEQAKAFANVPVSELIRVMLGLTTRLILAKFGRASFYEGVGNLPGEDLQGLAIQLDLKCLYSFLDLLFATKELTSRHTGFRDTDIAESLWLGLSDVLAGIVVSKER